MSTTMLKRDLGIYWGNIGLIGVSSKWSYVTASPSHHDQAIPILSPALFMRVAIPIFPFLKFKEFLIYLFIVVELHCLLNYLHVRVMGFYCFAKFCCSKPFQFLRSLNVLPGGAYCCFTRTTLLLQCVPGLF